MISNSDSKYNGKEKSTERISKALIKPESYDQLLPQIKPLEGALFAINNSNGWHSWLSVTKFKAYAIIKSCEN